MILYGYVELQIDGIKVAGAGAGDAVGEETLLDGGNSVPKKPKQFEIYRNETVVAKNESFLFEIEYVNYLNIRDQMTISGL